MLCLRRLRVEMLCSLEIQHPSRLEPEHGESKRLRYIITLRCFNRSFTRVKNQPLRESSPTTFRLFMRHENIVIKDLKICIHELHCISSLCVSSSSHRGGRSASAEQSVYTHARHCRIISTSASHTTKNNLLRILSPRDRAR